MALVVGKGRKVVLDEVLEDKGDDKEVGGSLDSTGDVDDVVRGLKVGNVSGSIAIGERKVLSEVTVGMGWSGLTEGESGFFGNLFGDSKGIDLDMSVFILDRGRKLLSNEDVIYFNNLRSSCGSVVHEGDTRRSDVDDGDNEKVNIRLEELPKEVGSLVIVSTIHGADKSKNHFGLAKDAFVRLYNDRTGKEILRFDLTDDFEGDYSVLVAEIKREGGKWEFNGLGKGLKIKTLNDIKSIFV